MQLSIVKHSDRSPLELSWAQVKVPLLFMLSLSLTGLSFYPAILLALAIMVRQYKTNPYNFIIMAMILFDGYGILNPKMLPGIRLEDFNLVIGFALLFLYKKNKVLRQTTAILIVYALCLFLLALFSIESLAIQFTVIRTWLNFVFFIIPVVVFSRREFDINIFFRQIIIFGLIICGYYIIDAVILGGNVLVPHVYNWRAEISTFYHPVINPFHIFRKYPPGLILLVIAVYPISRYYRLSWWQWAMILAALAVSQTFSIIAAYALAYIFFQGKIKQLLKYFVLGILAFVALYFIDGTLPKVDKEITVESTLRIKSSVDQFIDIFDAVDEEDIALFASGRMAQIIPKVELVFEQGKQWTGLGFLNPERSKINRYIIINELYSDEEESEELAIGVENEPADVFLTIGFIGLLVHALFFYALWRVIRRYKYASLYLCTLFICFVGGMSSWTNLNSYRGLLPLAMSFAVILLANRPGINNNTSQQ